MSQFYQKVEQFPETGQTFGTGWLPPLPDLRDYTAETPTVATLNATLKITPATPRVRAELGPPRAIPAFVNLRQWCSPIENQLNLGSCTANAAAGVLEYCENRAFGTYLDASRLFIYKITRNLLGWVGDTGAWLRNTMGALVLCGAPPERYWPYTDRTQPGPEHGRTFDEEPTSFVYSLANKFTGLQYFCHDPMGANRPKPDVLNSVKTYIAAGFPSMFGFYGFPSANAADVKGAFPYPCPGERAIWGHAIVAVGYDDTLRITNKNCNRATTGALLIRNSWGTAWGDAGYGWLPYDYVLNGLALDFWTLIRSAWVDTGQFGLQ